MRRILTSSLLLACLAPAAWAEDEEPRPTRAKIHPEMIPLYTVIGLPRDLLDAPMKGMSSIPVFNRIFLPPLAILNGITALTSWSFTKDGMAGGLEAWVACLDMPRKAGKPRPVPMQGRPAWKNYFPNLRAFRVVTHEPVPE